MEELLLRVVPGLPTLVLLLVIAVCIGLLSKGADWAIDGVVALASRTGLPRIVIGATIVSLGTTLPEAFVSVMAAWTGNPGLALGNAVGSIIADTGLILGVACVMTRVPMNKFILNRTGWVQVGSATLLVAICVASLLIMPEPIIKREIGILFLILLAIYMYATYRWAKSGGDQSRDGEVLDESDEEMGIPKSLLMIFGGLFLVILGARVLIPCASEVAVRFGVPQDIIAATLVAFGTSLPELMTAFAAIRKGHPEIMVGNVVGADVLNCLFVIGASASATPLAIPKNFFLFHFPVMLVILWSFRAFIAMQNKKGYFERWQGGWMLGIYIVYVILQYALNVNIPH
jgi:cation:H+ antiporter